MRLVPLVGITDFTSFEQVENMLTIYRAQKKDGSERRLHVGVMMSRKTLRGEPTKYTSVFPPKEKVASIFVSKEVYNCLHYADYESDPDRVKNLYEALTCGGIDMNAVQLDMVWPDPKEIAEAVKKFGQEIEIILQLNSKAMEQVGDSPTIVVQKLEEYRGLIHRVLVDKSGEKGIGMDATAIIPYVRAIRDRFPDWGLVVAGGLGPNTLHLVEPIASLYPSISIDAQGKLRPSGSNLDPVDWGMAGQYLTRALKLLK